MASLLFCPCCFRPVDKLLDKTIYIRSLFLLICRYQAPVSASRKKTSDHRRQKPGHSAKKKNETTEIKHSSGDTTQGKGQTPKAKRFRPSEDK